MDEDERHINLHATPEMMAGVYANFANVSHSDYEFSITFVRLDHESEENGELNGVVVSRVNLSTRFMKELVRRHERQLRQVAPGGEHQEPARGARARASLAEPSAGAELPACRRSARQARPAKPPWARADVRPRARAACQNGQAGAPFGSFLPCNRGVSRRCRARCHLG